jgi:hypothetical protein
MPKKAVVEVVEVGSEFAPEPEGKIEYPERKPAGVAVPAAVANEEKHVVTSYEEQGGW